MKKLSLLIFVALAFAFSIQAQTSTNNSASSSATTETKEKKKVFRAVKDQVMQAQRMLKQKSKYLGAEDGKYNDDFRVSIKCQFFHKLLSRKRKIRLIADDFFISCYFYSS